LSVSPSSTRMSSPVSVSSTISASVSSVVRRAACLVTASVSPAGVVVKT
jgi:hypothetical protein